MGTAAMVRSAQVLFLFAPTALSAPAPPVAPFHHNVVKGETIDMLAKRYGVTQNDVRLANSLNDENVDFIGEGQDILIPIALPSEKLNDGDLARYNKIQPHQNRGFVTKGEQWPFNFTRCTNWEGGNDNIPCPTTTPEPEAIEETPEPTAEPTPPVKRRGSKRQGNTYGDGPNNSFLTAPGPPDLTTDITIPEPNRLLTAQTRKRKLAVWTAAIQNKQFGFSEKATQVPTANTMDSDDSYMLGGRAVYQSADHQEVTGQSTDSGFAFPGSDGFMHKELGQILKDKNVSWPNSTAWGLASMPPNDRTPLSMTEDSWQGGKLKAEKTMAAGEQQQAEQQQAVLAYAG